MGKGVENGEEVEESVLGKRNVKRKYDDDKERIEGCSEQEKIKGEEQREWYTKKEVEKWCTDNVLSFTS